MTGETSQSKTPETRRRSVRLSSCLSSHGFHTLITYQPASRFWALQGIEAGIFISLATALIILACRVVLTRDA